MYVTRSELESAYRSLGTQEIHARLASGDLLDEAREVATAELESRARRGESTREPAAATGASAAPAARPPQRNLSVKVLLGVYVAFLLVCLAGVVADPPSRLANASAYEGMVGLIASAAAGFPWSFAALMLMAAVAPRWASSMHPWLAVGICWFGVAVNLGLFRRFFRRAPVRRTNRDA